MSVLVNFSFKTVTFITEQTFFNKSIKYFLGLTGHKQYLLYGIIIQKSLSKDCPCQDWKVSTFCFASGCLTLLTKPVCSIHSIDLYPKNSHTCASMVASWSL